MSSLFALPMPRFPQRDLHGAALVDAQGREIPITEAMIQRACKELEQAWHYPTPRAQKAG